MEHIDTTKPMITVASEDGTKFALEHRVYKYIGAISSMLEDKITNVNADGILQLNVPTHHLAEIILQCDAQEQRSDVTHERKKYTREFLPNLLELLVTVDYLYVDFMKDDLVSMIDEICSVMTVDDLRTDMDIVSDWTKEEEESLFKLAVDVPHLNNIFDKKKRKEEEKPKEIK
jgi:hypothetical protein